MVGNVQIGGQNKVVIQSMCNTKTKDVTSTVKQILELEKAGCEIIRVACLDIEDAKAIKQIKEQIHIPIVADIHFDYRIALEAIEAGVDRFPGELRVPEGDRLPESPRLPLLPPQRHPRLRLPRSGARAGEAGPQPGDERHRRGHPPRGAGRLRGQRRRRSAGDSPLRHPLHRLHPAVCSRRGLGPGP